MNSKIAVQEGNMVCYPKTIGVSCTASGLSLIKAILSCWADNPNPDNGGRRQMDLQWLLYGRELTIRQSQGHEMNANPSF